jgi:hypothetical protein
VELTPQCRLDFLTIFDMATRDGCGSRVHHLGHVPLFGQHLAIPYKEEGDAFERSGFLMVAEPMRLDKAFVS